MIRSVTAVARLTRASRIRLMCWRCPTGASSCRTTTTRACGGCRPTGSSRRSRGDGDIYAGSGPEGDGGPAVLASIDDPTGLALWDNEDVLIAGHGRVRRVDATGTISTLVDLMPMTPQRVGDFAGRLAGTPHALAVTPEGGVAMAAGPVYYWAPKDTTRTLVALRDARVSRRHVSVDVDATRTGTARLEVRRGGRLMAASVRRIRPGRRTLHVRGRFPPLEHLVRVTLTGPDGARGRDKVSLLTSRAVPNVVGNSRLADRLRKAADRSVIDRCRRQTRRRIDCVLVFDDPGCTSVLAVMLRRSGVLFRRNYRCESPKRPFRRDPRWLGPASRFPD